MRTISTTCVVTIDENTHSIDERQPQYVHREINGAAATDLGAGVVPLGAGRENLEHAAGRMGVPSASGRLLDGLIARVRLAVNREQCQGVFAAHLAKRCQRRAIKRSTHHVPSEASKPSPDPSRLLASNGGWGYSKDRSVDPIKKGRNDVDTRDSNLTYQLRLGLFRAVCTNGLIVSVGAFPAYCVAHRGDVVDQVVTAALEASERFEALASRVERMELRRLDRGEQIGFAGKALALRFPELDKAGIQPSRLLECRRVDDTSDNLWTVFNRVQENLLGGGLIRRTETGRLSRTRRITSIREDVRLNGRLWDLAEEVLAA